MIMKTASPLMDTLKEVLTSIAVGTSVGTGLMGVGYLIDKFKANQRERNLGVYFEQMLMKHPDLNLKYMGSKEDKERIQDIFEMLEHFAPKVAENPLASGAFVKKIFELGRDVPDTSMIEALSKITKNYSDIGGSLSSGVLKKMMESSVPMGFKPIKIENTKPPQLSAEISRPPLFLTSGKRHRSKRSSKFK